MKIKLSQIINNPYRDLNLFPINRAKVDKLKESIKDTTFWDNLLCRPEGNTLPDFMVENQTDEAVLAGLSAAYNDDGPLFNVELSYGHHRLEALRELGYEEIDIPCKAIDDTTMLKQMANENRDDWTGNMSVILETVRQARTFLLDSIAPYASYEEYEQAGGSFFSKAQFAQIDAQGIGFKQITKFLGETWSDQDVRKAVAVLKNIDEGLYEQEQVIAFPSIGVLGGFSKLAEAIKAQAWPDFFKDEMVNEAALMIADPKMSTTVKILGSATQAAKDGKDPVRIIKSPGQKRRDFNIVKAIKDRCYQNMNEDTKLELADLPEMDGFKDFPGLDEVIADVEKSIKRSQVAQKAADDGKLPEGVDPEELADSAEGVDPSGDADADLDAMINDAKSQVAPETEGEMPDVPGEDADVAAVPDAEVFASSVTTMSAQLEAIEGNWADIDQATAEPALEQLLRSTLSAMITLYGADTMLETVEAIAAEA